MADVRALLKAKRQEARITHPYAAYGGAGGGTLRCTACGVAVKFASGGARGDDDGDEDEDEDEEMEPQRPPEKRQRTEEREESGADAQTQTQRGARQAFPMDFFSDPSRAPHERSRTT
ncbi:hypothetical protein BC826DRAFT_1104949 [Russula brevipes]|nr:hypothetical protein BC826DRAFT_1104949 [Russula brevipes]